MLPYTVHELATALQGSPQHVDPQTKVSGLTTDSRKIQPGQLHQRVPFYIGSPNMVEDVLRHLSN